MRLGVSCPGCGATVSVGAAETAVLCDSCGSAHLVLRGGGAAVAGLASRTTDEEACALAAAAVNDEHARRRRSAPAPTVDGIVSFDAPVRVLVSRIHEAAVVRGAGGDPEAEVTARLAETSATALRDPLGLPTAPALREIGASPPVLDARLSATTPPFDAGGIAFDADAARAGSARPAETPALARHVVAVTLARVLLLRPCRLVSVSSGSARAAVLVDGAARQATALLSAAAADALRGELAERPLPGAEPAALRPMRCPACASPYPLDREGQLRICPSCRRAHLVAGRRLVPLRYEAERPASPRGRLLVPAWRTLFSLVDPLDGAEVASVAALEARCGAPDPAAPGGPVPLDVPAFLPADRRRERRGTQRLPALPPCADPVFEGPARGEAGFPEPRPLGATGPDAAVAVLRHALLASLRAETVARASPRRLRALLFEAPLRAGAPRLVLRALRRADVEGPP